MHLISLFNDHRRSDGEISFVFSHAGSLGELLLAT
jgi:hypothetical protein